MKPKSALFDVARQLDWLRTTPINDAEDAENVRGVAIETIEDLSNLLIQISEASSTIEALLKDIKL